jgi:NAD(P)-dependent dehydrogenase (short-subunit alcohol dehydrogenase family)
MVETFSLKGKRVLVTGASSGIGKEISLRLSQQEAKLIITGRNPQKLNETFSVLWGTGHQQEICDLTQLIDINSLVEHSTSLDGVIFCAGIIEYMPAKQINENMLNSTIKLNFESQILLYQSLHDQRKLKIGASLVFISSVSALSAVPATLAYAASKAAINSSVRVLATELAKYKIRVNSISPGLIKSPFLNKLEEQTLLENEKKYPLGFPEESDVSNAVIFLLSDASRHVTGINLVVDGGYLLHN